MFFNKQKKYTYLRNLWAKPIDRFRNFDLISIYHSNISQNSNAEFVDERTWNDLSLDKLFEKLDRCFSPLGQQFLYHSMHKYETNQKLIDNRQNLIERLKKDSQTREAIQLELDRLDSFNLNYVPSIVFSDIPDKPKYYYLIFLSPIIATLSALLIPLNPMLTLVTIAAFITNIILNKIFTKNIYDLFAGFSGLNQMLISANRIGKLKVNADTREIIFLGKEKSLIRSLSRKLGKLVIDKSSLNDLALGIIEYLNMFFLYDLYAYYRSLTVLTRHRNEVHNIFKAIATLDLAQSLASYLTEKEAYTIPQFIETKEINIQNQYHPLVDNAVSCTLDKLKKSVLITGSNMAGKTTFIKSIGINFILAQTLNFCHAEKAIIPRLIIKSAIRREENIDAGKSYFFVEIEELQEFIELSSQKNNYLFLIDEIFRGTNAVERLSISTAVLEHLNKNSTVLVTTHDIELQELLNNSYKMFHFSDAVENRKFYFTYQLLNGPCKSGNAIKLIDIKGYPKTIVERAKDISSKLLT